MSMSNITFYNVKSIVITPTHFEAKNPANNNKSMELVMADKDGERHTIVVFGNLSGENTAPEISFAPTNVIKLP